MNRLFADLAAMSAGSLFALGQTPAEDMFPFVVEGLATPPAGSVVDVSWLNDSPAGAHGFVRALDGHFVDGRGRRLLGLREFCLENSYDPSNWRKLEREVMAPPRDEDTLRTWGKALGLQPSSEDCLKFFD